VDKDKDERDLPRVEDYGGPGDYPDSGQNSEDQNNESEAGKYSGGTTGTHQGSSEGEWFGEYGDTGTGIDLTEEMDETGTHSGLIKGGEQGASDVADPAQYGGEAGGPNKGKKLT
jgi:hypothetical protein